MTSIVHVALLCLATGAGAGAEASSSADAQVDAALPKEAKPLEKDMAEAKKKIEEKTEPEKATKDEAGKKPDSDEKPAAAASEASGAAEGQPSPGSEQRAKEAGKSPGSDAGTGDWGDDARWRRYRERNEKAGHHHVPPHGRRLQRATPGADVWLGARPPQLLRHRDPWVGLALGGIIGFGTADYYAGNVRRGLMLSTLDAVLVAGFVGTTVALNKLVISHDFRSGRSLARGEREFGRRETRLYNASVLLAVGVVASHLYQGVSGMLAARRTNALIDSFSFVPLGGGAGAQMTLDF